LFSQPIRLARLPLKLALGGQKSVSIYPY